MQQLQRVAIYARVSSEPHSSGQTIASQLEALQVRASSDGQKLTADQCFVDDGFSGATLLRPALERLRDLVAAGGLDRVYVHSPDRLARHYAYQENSRPATSGPATPSSRRQRAAAARSPAGRCTCRGVDLCAGAGRGRSCLIRGCAGAAGRESSTEPAERTRGTLSTARSAGLPAVRLCLLRQACQPVRGKGQTTGLCILPELR